MKKIKMILITLLTVALIGLLTGCGSKSETTDNAATQTPTDEAGTETPATEGADLSGTVTITGSTSVEKILHDMIDEFTALNPDVTINYTGTGSSAGISGEVA